jgi:hypothetical protein
MTPIKIVSRVPVLGKSLLRYYFRRLNNLERRILLKYAHKLTR